MLIKFFIFHLYSFSILFSALDFELARISHTLSQNLDNTVYQPLSSKSQSLLSNNVSGTCENKSRQTLYQPFVKFCEKFELASDAAILINADSGKILFEKNANKKVYPASTTKLATLLYVLDKKFNWTVNDIVVAKRDALAAISTIKKKRSNYNVAPYWIEVGSSHMGIKLAEELPFKVLLYGMTIASANDAANVIAQHISGSVTRFVGELNLYLKEIGCTSTFFCNPHGLHHPKHVTSAYDMALIAQTAMRNKFLMKIVKTGRYKRPKTNKQKETWLVNVNQLISKNKKFYYSHAIGMKTGSTLDANYNLVAAAEKNGRKLIAVVMNCKEKGREYEDVIKMFDAIFSEKKEAIKLLSKGEQKKPFNIHGKFIKGHIKEDVIVNYYKSEKPNLKGEYIADNLKFPVKPKTKIGSIKIVDQDQDKIIKTIPVFATGQVNQISYNWLYFTSPLVLFILIFIYRKKTKG